MSDPNSRLVNFREQFQAQSYIVGNKVAILRSGFSASESQYDVAVFAGDEEEKGGCFIVQKGSAIGGSADTPLASGDFAQHPLLKLGYIRHPFNFIARQISGESRYVTQSIMAPQGFTEAAFNSVKPTVPGGMLVIDLGYLHKAWQFSGSDYKDPYRKDAQVNELLVLPGSWDGSELGTRVSFWLSAVTSPYTTFLGNNPLIWQKIKGDGLISLTVPKTRISQRILAPGEKFTFMDNTKLLGLSASMAYEANFSPYETKIKKGGPFFPTTVHGPGVLLEMQ